MSNPKPKTKVNRAAPAPSKVEGKRNAASPRKSSSPSGPPAPPAWKSRIVGSGQASPTELIANDLNWRTHPAAQIEALGAAIGRIGFIRSVTVNRRTGRIIDGHARVKLALEQKQATIPVEYVDLSEAEEAEALLTLDPISAMAGADVELLNQLRETTNLAELPGFEPLDLKLDELSGLEPTGTDNDGASDPSSFQPQGAETQSRLDRRKPIACPHCGKEFTPGEK